MLDTTGCLYARFARQGADDMAYGVAFGACRKDGCDDAAAELCTMCEDSRQDEAGYEGKQSSPAPDIVNAIASNLRGIAL